MHTVEEDEGGGGLDGQRSTIRVTKEKISRQASIGTARVLHTLPATPRAGGMDLLLRVVAVFREPLRSEHTEYLGSSRFADDLLELSARAGRRFETEPRVLRLESPAYVFGDTHGNLEDLHFFSDHIWKLGVSLTVWKPNLQPDFNVSVCDSFDTISSAVLRELDESNRFVQKSAESTSI